MYRSLSAFFFLLLFLAGCQTDTDLSSNTPEGALEQIHSKGSYAKPMELYKTIEIEEGRVIVIYKGSIYDDDDIYVANIEKIKEKWSVTDAQNIGMPLAEKLNQSILTESFQAGYTTDKVSSDENVRTVEFKDSDYYVWIKIF